MRRRGRTDTNQQEVMDTLRRHGVSVACLSGVGGGVGDILAGFNGVNYLLEVKNLAGRGARFTPDEERFMVDWRGQYSVVFTPSQALKVLGLEEKEGE